MSKKLMETKNPKTRLLFTILILAVFTFIGIKFGLDSYWSIQKNAYAEEILPPNAEINDLRAKQKKDLESSPTPINAAMQQLATRGRNTDPNITPQPSNDLDPLRGWSKLKKDIPEPPPPPPPVPTAVAPTGDGGAPLATDGGAAPLAADAGPAPAATDAGAPAPKADGGR